MDYTSINDKTRMTQKNLLSKFEFKIEFHRFNDLLERQILIVMYQNIINYPFDFYLEEGIVNKE